MPVRKASFGLCVASLSSVIYLALHYVTNSINNAVKEPYMDEIFHVPQAQRYCQSNLTYYDPKITTPPGLYLLTMGRIWLRDIILLRKTNLICDTIDLRRTNHSIAILNFVTLVLIQLVSGDRVNLTRKVGFKSRATHTLNNLASPELARIILSSLVLLLLPPLFFFNSLYYTDPGSVLFTLLVYLFSLINQHSLAALCGAVSISFRQTNIVWVFYVACLTIVSTIEEHGEGEGGSHGEREQQEATAAGRKVRSQQRPDSTTGRPLRICGLIASKDLLVKLIARCAPYSLVGASFVVFVVVNGGIVLGDKEAHQPRLHFAQVLYFLGFCTIFGCTWLFHMRILRRFLYFTIRTPHIAVLASGLIIYLISFGRYAHPYLLADNRHITFYVWRRILDRHNSYVPLVLTPIYLVSSFSIWHHLRTKGCKRLLLFIFCTLLVTVPNGLLELRYFIMPYIFLRLSAETSLESTIVELFQQLSIISSMHYLFIHKTFQWADSLELQRIMW